MNARAARHLVEVLIVAWVLFSAGPHRLWWGLWQVDSSPRDAVDLGSADGCEGDSIDVSPDAQEQAEIERDKSERRTR